MIGTDYIFSRKNGEPASTSINTLIGGQATEIPTAAALAAILEIPEADITQFNIVGDNIEARIENPYPIPNSTNGTKFSTTDITYFKDLEQKVTRLEIGAFNTCTSLKNIDFKGASYLAPALFDGVKIFEFYFPEALESNSSTFYQSSDNEKQSIFYLPKCVKLGNSSTDGVFYNISAGSRIYANPFLETNNNGGLDADLSYAINRGALVSFVQNFDKPANITDLSSETAYATALKLTLTPPASLNGIEFYQVFVNGVFNRECISVNDIYAKDLNPSTNYNITVRAVDIYYNSSEATINATTGTTDATIESTNHNTASGIADPVIQEEVHYFVLYAKLSGMWDRMKAFYLSIGSTHDETKYNLKSTSQYTLEIVNAPTFGSNRWTGGNRSTGIYPQDLEDQNYHISFFSLAHNGGTHQLVGSVHSGQQMIRHLISSGQLLNDAYADTSTARCITPLPQTTGLLTIERIDFNIQRNYRNGLLIEQDSNGNEGTKPTRVFSINGGGVPACFVCIGNHLTKKQNEELNRLIVKLNTALGR